MKPLLLLLPVLLGLLVMTGLLADGLRLQARRIRHRRLRQAQAPRELMVARRRDFTDELFAVTLIDPAQGRLAGFLPGQYVSLEIESQPNVIVKRCYSLAAWEEYPRSYQLAIRRVDGGLASNWLHRHLTPGQRIRLSAPRGRFVLNNNRNPVVLIGAGIGITPLRAMLQACLAKTAYRGVPIDLFHAVRYEDELCYRQEFVNLAQRHPRFSYHPFVSRPAPNWPGANGRLDARRILALAGNPDDSEFYICARQEMTETLRSGLQLRGITASRIHSELFTPIAGQTGTGSFRIDLDGNSPVAFQNHPTLLKSLQQAGIPIDSDCGTGQCGVCRVRLLQGRYRWLITPEAPLAEDEILACCSVPLTDLSLRLCG